MSAVRVVPTFEPFKYGHPGFRFGFESTSAQQFALESREEAFRHGVVVGISDRSHRGHDVRFLTALAEGVARILGEFNRSSQRLMNGGCDEREDSTIGSGTTCEDEVARTASCFAPIGTTTVLAGNRGGLLERGCGSSSRNIGAGRYKMVSGVWRNAPIAFGCVGAAADWKVPFADGARADRIVASAR
jgi:hypothetical protein